MDTINLTINMIAWLAGFLNDITANGAEYVLNGILVDDSSSYDITEQITKFVDEYAAKLISHLGEFTTMYLVGSHAVTLGQNILSIGFLFYLGYEMWPCILGRKAPDVTKLLRPIMIAVFISAPVYKSTVETLMKISGNGEKSGLTYHGREFYKTQWNKLKDTHAKVEQYKNELKEAGTKDTGEQITQTKTIEENIKNEGKDPTAAETTVEINEDDDSGLVAMLKEKWENFTNWAGTKIDALLKLFENKIAEMLDSIQNFLFAIIEDVVEFICTLYLQTCFYGIMMIGEIGKGILALFGPIIIAMSIFEVWSDAWAKWLMKFLSFSLYGLLAYIVMGYVYSIVYYELLVQEEELKRAVEGVQTFGFAQLRQTFNNNWAILINWVVALLTGGYCMRFVPGLADMIFETSVGSAASSAAGAIKEGASKVVNLVKS